MTVLVSSIYNDFSQYVHRKAEDSTLYNVDPDVFSYVPPSYNFYVGGIRMGHFYRDTRVNTYKLSLVSQVSLLHQLAAKQPRTGDDILAGTTRIFWGLWKKAVFADWLSLFANQAYNNLGEATAADLLLATYAFAFQIYLDFSAYSDIAIGLARVMGIDLRENFRWPYVARNISEFWRRWHISLSTWLRDYLYIPLGGNRGGTLFTYRNLFLTMVLGGIWHGAAWPFVLWGAYHGALLVAHRLARPWLARLAAGGGLWWTARVLVTFHLVCFGWLLFRSETVAQLGRYLVLLSGPLEAGLALAWLLPFAVLVAPLLLVEIAQARSGDLAAPLGWRLPLRVATYTALLFIFVTLGEDGGQPFVYFQF